MLALTVMEYLLRSHSDQDIIQYISSQYYDQYK